MPLIVIRTHNVPTTCRYNLRCAHCIAQLNERRQSWQKLVPHDSLGGWHLKEGGRVGSCPPQRCLASIQQTAVMSGVSLLSAACTLCSMRSLLTCLLRTCITAYAAASSWHYKISSAFIIWQVQAPPAKKPSRLHFNPGPKLGSPSSCGRHARLAWSRHPNTACAMPDQGLFTGQCLAG